MAHSNTIGRLYGVGLGPGDPELITVKALRILREVPVIAFPEAKKGANSYAYQIIEEYINPEEKKLLNLEFPMLKDQDLLENEWKRAAEEVWQYLKEGQDVAFVTEGDSLFYSTFIYLDRYIKQIQPNVEVVPVPGISSILSSAASLRMPLVEGNQILAVVPAGSDREAMKKALEEHDTVVFIKVAKVLDLMIELLKEMNLLKNAAVVSKSTSKEERVWTDLSELEGIKIPYLSLMVVKK